MGSPDETKTVPPIENQPFTGELAFADTIVPFQVDETQRTFWLRIDGVRISAPDRETLQRATGMVRHIVEQEREEKPKRPLSDADIADITKEVEGAAIERISHSP